MDQEPIVPAPAPTDPPSAVHADAHPAHPGNRRIKRRFMIAVVGLYLLSLAAACVVILRGPAQNSAQSGKETGKSLLSLASDREAVGWVSIHGPIYNSQSGRMWEKGAELWTRRIKLMSETKGIKAIVLDINSPGGSVGAVQEMYSQILRIRKDKKIPFVALFGDVAASGGYYIAAACDKIVAHPGTLTGSIGVIFSVSNLEGLFGKVGYKLEAIKSGKFKDIASPARAMTADERSLLQALIDDAYSQFLAAVSSGRNMPVDKVRPLADGRIYSGSQAQKAGLVDVLGDSEDALALAGKLGGISGQPKVKRDGEHISDIFELLDSKFSGVMSGGVLESLSGRQYPGLEYRWRGL
ncbi:MAG: signal peptide peptidase SppA [Elusimicrobiota bacterium]|jgi:protease-4